ncbi:MAG TPA: hypothetical protein VFN10_05265 [Thermoanaerobaculia bacterium]|nr:hypothetical protein [Thermoanaerobaculia bacterium]
MPTGADGDRFFLRDTEAYLTFDRAADGTVTALHLHSIRDNLTATRVH